MPQLRVNEPILGLNSEYVNNNFTSYCTTHGIQLQHTVPYTPQQNGVVERKNHTLKEMVNCMIQSKGLSLKYWRSHQL